ncbi:MAG: IS110 family transposase, partial [Planctomycetes bacterium]|nr:IS110 family transposase [Planctomycetota bacterium]
MTDSYQLLVGVDWASEEHEVCVVDSAGREVGARAFKHTGTGLAELVAWLLEKGDPSSIAVAIEVPHGSVVETLLERGFAVFSINPKQLDRFRDRFTLAGAKDDRRDALVLASSLRTDTPLFRKVSQLAGEAIELREWSRIHDQLQSERLSIVNQMRAQLARFFPAFLKTVKDPGEDWAIALFAAIPSPSVAAKAFPVRIQKLLKDHRIRRITGEELLEQLRAEPVYSSPGTAEAAGAHLKLLGERALLINRQLRDCHKQLEACLEKLTETDPGNESEQRDATIILTMPGIGVKVAATLLAEADELLRARDYRALRALTGVAPVTKRSGKKCIVIRRTACHPRLRNAVYHWARVASMYDLAAKEHYAGLRARGKSHGQALRSVADRLLAVLCAMLRDGS